MEGKRPAAVAGLEDTAAKKFTSDAVATPSASDRSDEQARLLAALELANEVVRKPMQSTGRHWKHFNSPLASKNPLGNIKNNY